MAVLYQALLSGVVCLLLVTPAAAEWYDVSEYLLGKVYVKVFFVQSSGGSETWTLAEKAVNKNIITHSNKEVQ